MPLTKIHLADYGFLAAITVGTSLPYAPRLGFYSDDWAFLEALSSCPNQSVWGLFDCIDETYRPMQFFQLAALYRFFGSNPLGYHVFNSVLFAALILLLYVVVREVCESRLVALAIALVFALLPHYSTDRFWIASFQANLCIALYLASVSCALLALHFERPWRALWAACSGIAMVLSALAYEVAIPLFVLLPILIWRRLKPSQRKPTLVVTAAVTTAAVAFKFWTQTRVEFHGQFLQHLGLVLSHATEQLWDFNYGYYGFMLPRVAWRAASVDPRAAALALSAAAGTTICSYLFYTARASRVNWPSQRTWAWISLAGLVIFVLAYLPFAADVTSDITTTGVGNRIAIGCALGTAASLVGVIGWVTTAVSTPEWRAGLFSACTSLLCVAGLVTVNTIACYWVEASRIQQELIAKLKSTVPVMPRNTVLMLDGICPYHGPGIVFEAGWDATGMLWSLYHDQTLRGDVITPKLEVRPDGLHKVIYGSETSYPYSESLIVFDFQSGSNTPLADLQAARVYFDGPRRHCAAGAEGYGTRIF